MELLPDLATLADDDLERLIRELEDEEDEISKRRRLLHGRIDILRTERVQRLTTQLAEDGEVEVPAGRSVTLERPLFQGTGELPEGGEIEPMPDLATLDDDALRTMIHELEQEEDDISLQRRFLHGRIDILRAERYCGARAAENGIRTGSQASSPSTSPLEADARTGMSHVYCPECGFQNPEAANFCSRCGAALLHEEAVG